MNKHNVKNCLDKCNIGYLIKGHVKVLLQALTNDYPEYNFRLQTTKCLNTAVMLVLFLVGKRGLALANACDTREVIKRNNDGVDNNNDVVQALKTQLFSKKEKKRTIYYILLSDGHFEKQGQSTNVYFPGHVFVLEKVWDSMNKKHFFNFYQSYINRYDLKQHVKHNKGLELSFEKATLLIDNLEHVLSSPLWDNESAKRWKDVTFVDTPEFLNSKSHNKFFLCFRKAKSDICLRNIERYVKAKLRTLKNITSENSHTIYGNKDLYENPAMAFTNGQMKDNLQIILNDINQK
jgi:hypothetical protein